MNPEDLLTDALHDRVERTDYPSTPLSAVAGRAGALRARRRRTTALAAAAAVAVVIVPGALWLGRSPDAAPRPGQTLSSGPSSDPTAPTVAGPLPLGALPLGQKPGIDYLVGDTYVTMNGDRITSPTFASADTATPARGGILAAVPPSSGGDTRPDGVPIYLVTGGSSQKLGCGVDRFAMSTDGVESAYWLADSCAVGPIHGSLFSGVNNTMGEAGPGSVTTPDGVVYSPIGIVRQGVVAIDLGPDGSPRTPTVIAADGSTNRLTQLVLAGGSDENNDVVSGQLASNFATGAIVDATSGAVKARVPGWVLGQFSVDGKYVLGDQPRNGAIPDGHAIFDATTGHKLVDLPGLGVDVRFGQLAWDVDDTVLAVASNTDSSAIVRFDLHGHLTRATPLADTQAGYRLATRP